MSHYKSYPAYQDSGDQWLGLMPANWKTSSLKWKTKRFAGGTPDKNNLSYWENGVIPWLASGEVNQKLITQPTTYITEEAYRNSSAKWIPSGSLVMALAGQGKTRGTVAQLAIDSTCNQSMAAIVPEAISARFLYWWLESNYSNLRGLSGDDVRDGLNLEILGQITCPIPTRVEQKAIAAHLDRETARIDALITKKSRFIELLREKRQALIAHAVTKGLDLNVRMKDSGVEWLGEVPEHWDVRPLKQLARLDGGAGFPDDEQGSKDAPIPFFKVANLANGMTTAENHITPEAAERLRAKIFPAGTIAFAKVGAALLLNRRVMMPIPGCADNNLMFAIPQGVSGEWLLSVLSCFDMAWLVNPGAVPSVNQEQVGNIKIPVPSAEEQVSIVASVRSGTTRIDALAYKTERSIELLKERRSALITAAVTGQIDLREAA